MNICIFQFFSNIYIIMIQILINLKYVIHILLIIIFIIGIISIFLNDSLYVASSLIHGVGIFTKLNLFKNKKIYKAINKNKNITFFGSKINHSNNPNTYLKETNDGWFIYSLNYIKKMSELTLNYNDTPDFIMKPNLEWK